MAWIELHQTLPRHPKLIRLANRLRVHPAQAAGHLTFLWLWTLDYAPTGDMSRFGPAEISAAACFPGDAELFAKALIEFGWLDEATDGSVRVHNWDEYAGRLIASREGSKERMRKFRERSHDVTRNVRVTEPQRSELPYRTVPNSTQPETERAQAHADPPVEFPDGFPRTESDAVAHADFVGCTKAFAKLVWDKACGRGGRDSRDVPIRRFRSHLASEWAYQAERENREKLRETTHQGRAPAKPLSQMTEDEILKASL